MSNPTERYHKLNLKESLAIIQRYPAACEELSFIVRLAYNKVSKNLQTVIFHDALTAFRLLPEMQSSWAISAAHLLVKSAESALPRQRKNWAMAEFKQAKVAQKRRKNRPQEEMVSSQLPQDVLVHIFSFLDLRSLVTAGLVCWSWNLTSMDNHLWQVQYSLFFGDSNLNSKGNGVQRIMREGQNPLEEETHAVATIDWRRAFRKAYVGSSSRSLRYHRGYCNHCNAIVWHNSLKCPNENLRIKLISPRQVVDYIVDDSFAEESSSDSESDEAYVSKLWAYPRWTEK